MEAALAPPVVTYDQLRTDESDLRHWESILADDQQRFEFDKTQKALAKTFTEEYSPNWDSHVQAFDHFCIDGVPSIVATNNQASFIHKNVRTSLICSNITYSRQTYIAPDGVLSQMTTQVAQQNNYSKILKCWVQWELIQTYEPSAAPTHSTLRMSNSARVAAGSASKVASKRKHKGSVQQRVNELGGQTKRKPRRHPFIDSETLQPVQPRTIMVGNNPMVLPRFITGEEGQRQYGTPQPIPVGSQILNHEIFDRCPLFQMPVPNGSIFSETGAPRWNGADDIYPAAAGTLAVSGNYKLTSPTKRLNCNQFFICEDGVIEIRCSPFRKQNHSTDNMYMYYSHPKTKPGPGGAHLGETMTAQLQFYRGQNLTLSTLLQALGTSQTEAEQMFILAAKEWWSPEVQRRAYGLLCDWKYPTASDALLFISKSAGGDPNRSNEDRVRYASTVLTNHVLPQVNGLHNNVNLDNRVKALTLVQAAWRAIMIRISESITTPHSEEEAKIKKHFKLDDQDELYNVRFDAGAIKLASQFRQKQGLVMAQMRNMLEKFLLEEHQVISLKFLFKHSKISGGIATCYSTNNFGGSKHSGKKAQTQVCQLLNQWNHRAILDHQARVAPSSGPETKQVKARQVVDSQYGGIDPSETPEGPSCGLVGYSAWQAKITHGVDPFPQIAIIWRDLERFRLILPSQWHLLPPGGAAKWVFHSGILIGFTLQPDIFVQEYRALRRGMVLDYYSSICYQPHQPHLAIEIWSDSGRFTRPLIRLKALRQIPHDQLRSVTTAQLLLWQAVEYIDISEARMLCVGWDMNDIRDRQRRQPKLPMTHIELHPRNFLGPSSGMVIFSNHIAGPRLTYSDGMAKQSIGPDLSSRTKMGPNRAHLHYGQRNLCMTDIEQTLGLPMQLDGQMSMTGLTAYLGWGQDDAIIMGLSSAERGFGHISHYKHFRDDERKDGSGALAKQQYHRSPPGVWDKKRAVDTHIHPKEGTPILNAVLGPHYVVMGKSVPIKRRSELSSVRQFSDRPNLCDASIVRKGESDPFCVVVKVVKNINTRGLASIKVLLRSFRNPVEANKWCTNHGQKGTVAIMMPQHLMPFDPVTGMYLDTVANCNMLTSRMTPPWLMEAAYNTIALRKGHIINSTAYEDMRLQGLSPKIENDLLKYGQPRNNARILCNGTDGEMMETPITVGPVQLKPLKHFVYEKQRVRGRGPIQSLTRQPTEGRSRDGGLRFGEMERDCMIAHGTTCMLNELFNVKSDAIWIHFCHICNIFGIGDQTQHRYQCRGCGSTMSVEVVPSPHVNKLLLQEQMAMLVKPRTFVSLLDKTKVTPLAVRAVDFADVNTDGMGQEDDQDDDRDEDDGSEVDEDDEDLKMTIAMPAAALASPSLSSSSSSSALPIPVLPSRVKTEPVASGKHVTWADHHDLDPSILLQHHVPLESKTTSSSSSFLLAEDGGEDEIKHMSSAAYGSGVRVPLEADEEDIDLQMAAQLENDMTQDFLDVAESDELAAANEAQRKKQHHGSVDLERDEDGDDEPEVRHNANDVDEDLLEEDEDRVDGEEEGELDGMGGEELEEDEGDEGDEGDDDIQRADGRINLASARAGIVSSSSSAAQQPPLTPAREEEGEDEGDEAAFLDFLQDEDDVGEEGAAGSNL